MPTYEYSCLVCSNQFEIEQRITDPVGVECPTCRVTCTNRLIPSSTSFALKGGGWSSDNYSKNNFG